MIGSWLQNLFSPEVLDNVVAMQAGKYFTDEAIPTAPRAPVQQPQQPTASPGFNAAAGAPAGGGSMIDSLTRLLSHPLTQGLAGGTGAYLAGPKNASGAQRFGRGLIGGINQMGEAQETQRRDALAKQQIRHQTDELAYRKDIDQQRLGMEEKGLEQRRNLAEGELAVRGFEPPEQRAASIAKLTEQAKDDPIGQRALKLLNPNSATPTKDYQEFYKSFNTLDSQEKRIEDKVASAEKIAAYKADLDRQRLILEGQKVDAVQQAALARIGAESTRAQAALEKAKNEAERATDKLEGSKQTAYGKSVADFLKSDAYAMADPAERPALVAAARKELASAYGLPPPKEEPAAAPAATPGLKPPAKPAGKATVESVLKKFGVPGY